MAARDPLSPKWSGRVVEQARAIVVTWLPQACGKCGEPVTSSDEWVVGHIKSRAAHPHLTMDVNNWWPEHRACSNRSGQAAVIEKAKADAIREIFPIGNRSGETPPLPVSPPGIGTYQPALPISLPFPTGDTTEVRDGLEWNPEHLARWPWLQPFLDIPEDASPPLYMSPPPPDAVGTYGPEAIAWIEAEQKITLRWWQRLAVTRQFEYRADGTLTCVVFIDSAPRRAGKSVRMRGVALWRLDDPLGLFNETQLVMHTGSDMAICREIQRQAWRWAEAKWGKDAVTKANGKEAIETNEGDRWLVRSQEGVYGYDVTYGMVDESWNVKPETVTEGIEPATLERDQPQVHLTSTSHRRATSLMRGRISDALARDDAEVVLLLWGAPPGSDAADPAVWRAASPHWSEARHKLIARKYEAALAGQADPEADDPDPLAGFTSQYLNVWRLKERRVERGEHVIEPEPWAALAALPPDESPVSAAIESWFADGVSLALARPVGSVVVVSVTDHPSVESAVETMRASGFRGRAVVGASLLDHPALRGVAKSSGERRTGAAVGALATMLREGVVRHNGGQHLTGQVTAIRTMPGADGPRIVSNGRADAVKVATWAIAQARPSTVPKRRKRLVTT